MSRSYSIIDGFTSLKGYVKGKFEKIGGANCYVSIPDNENYPKDRVILYLVDAYGIELINAQVGLCFIL